MAWTTPKVNWVTGDYFNLDPDYARIKGNIKFLIALSKTMYPDYDAPELEEAVMTGYPHVGFFNNVVNATKAMLEHCYAAQGTRAMRLYVSNGVAWSASELNVIENNHLLLYHAFMGQKAGIPRLEFTLGGMRFGS